MEFEAPDILWLLPPSTGASWVDWAILGTLAVVLGLGLWQRHNRTRRPVRRLRRALRRQRLTPRQAAHDLAAILHTRDTRQARTPSADLVGELDAMRFRREPPSPAQLLGLIVRVERAGSERPGDV